MQTEFIASPYTTDFINQRKFIYALMLSKTVHDIELRAIPSRYRVFTRDVSKMEWFIRKNWLSNLYFGAYTREDGGKTENVREGIWFYADLDFKGYEGGEVEAMSMIKAFEYQPTMIIHTGGGYHAYWMLAETIVVDQRNTKGILLGIADALNSDRAVCETARILRLPGTINYKYSPPRVCSVMEYEPERLYQPADFMKYWKEAEENHSNWVNTDREISRPDGDYAEDFLPHLNVVEVQSDELIAYCIFHDDKRTPNLHVNLSKGIYHCFTCGASGTAFDFKTEMMRRVIAGGKNNGKNNQ